MYLARVLRASSICSQYAGMKKSTFTPHYDRFRARLVELRRSAGLTQRQLAERVGRERSFVSRIELGERRLDVVEFFWVSRACGKDPATVSAELMWEFARLEDREKKKRSGRRR